VNPTDRSYAIDPRPAELGGGWRLEVLDEKPSRTGGGQRLLYWLDPVDYLADLAHRPLGPLQLFPTSIVQGLTL
jgi:hypothetical protein